MPSSALRATFLALSLSLALAACGNGNKPAGSETVATVNGETITLAELQSEAPNATTPEARDLALSRMIDRKLLASAADAAKLGDDPTVKIEAARALEIALANARGRALVAAAPAPSDQAIDKFIQAHPEAFANRRFLVIDQIELRGADGVLAGMAPANTPEALQAQLDLAKVAYQRNLVIVDTANASPQIVDRLLAVPAGEMFSMQAADAKVLGRVIEVRSQPFTGTFARQVAANLIKGEQLRAAVTQDVAALRKAAEGKIEYAEGYAAPK